MRFGDSLSFHICNGPDDCYFKYIMPKVIVSQGKQNFLSRHGKKENRLTPHSHSIHHDEW